MATTQAAMAGFEPSPVDLEIRWCVGRADDGMTQTAICDRFFPGYSPQWVRERIRRMALAGLLEIDRTCRPSRVRLPGRRC